MGPLGSWSGAGGGGVLLSPGEPPIPCFTARWRCGASMSWSPEPALDAAAGTPGPHPALPLLALGPWAQRRCSCLPVPFHNRANDSTCPRGCFEISNEIIHAKCLEQRPGRRAGGSHGHSAPTLAPAPR